MQRILYPIRSAVKHVDFKDRWMRDQNEVTFPLLAGSESTFVDCCCIVSSIASKMVRFKVKPKRGESAYKAAKR